MKTVTLHNLAQSTPEEVFFHVAYHLYKQGKKAEDKDDYGDGVCAYRAGKNNELKCAAGCLISDEEFFAIQPFNTESWATLIAENLVPSAHDKLINGLQQIHDNYRVEEWSTALRAYSLGAEINIYHVNVINDFSEEACRFRVWLRGQ